MTTIHDFIDWHRITMTAAQIDANPNMDGGENMDHWRCMLRRGRRRMTVIFSMGRGHNGRAPEIADVLDCLASDAAGFENASGFEDWCGEYGYETDSRKAERTYRTVAQQSNKLARFMDRGEAFQTLLFRLERR